MLRIAKAAGEWAYFAYGSNMSTPRLRCRVPSCKPLTITHLTGYQLRFHKRSNDGSSKCDLFHTGIDKDVVWGVVFEIAEGEKPALDRAEGLNKGYNSQTVVLTTPDGVKIEASTYVADTSAIINDLPTYTWYKDFVTAGAKEHNLPPAYIASAIEGIMAVADPDHEREKRERAKVCY